MDSQDRTQHRRILVNVVLEVVMVAILACVLWFTSMGSLESSQRSSSLEKLDSAAANVIDAQATADDLESQFDSRNQGTVDTLAYFYLRNDAIDARFAAMADAWSLSGLYLVDSTGGITMTSDGAVEPDTGSDGWSSLVSDSEPYTDGDVRYYISSINSSSYIVGAADVTSLKDEVAEVTDLASTVGGIDVGKTGNIAVIDTQGNVALAKDTSLIGNAASDYFSEVPADGFDGYVTFNGVKYFAQAQQAGDYTMVALVPASEFTGVALTKTVAVCAAFAIVSALIACYCQFLYTDARKRSREGRKADGSFKRLSSGSVANVAFLKKAMPIAVVGTICVFLVSWYAQSLVSLSGQISYNELNESLVTSSLDENEGKADSIKQSYNDAYISQATAISEVLAADTSLIDHDALEDIAQRDGLESIYVFNSEGQTVATSTTRYDYALPEDKEDQSYGFWDVVKGYEESYVREVAWSDGTGVTYFVGVSRSDEKGMVEIGISSSTLSNLLAQTEFSSKLDAIPVGNGGFLLAADGQTNAVTYAADSKYVGQDVTAQGVTVAALVDGYLGYQTVNGAECLVSTVYAQGNYIMVCVPTSHIGQGDLVNAIISALLGLILLIPCILQLAIQRKPGKASQPEGKGGASAAELDQPKGAIEVSTPTGTKTTRSITTRWSGTWDAWQDRTPSGKLAVIMKGLLLIACVVLLLCVYVFKDEGSALAYVVSLRWEKLPSIFSLTYIGVLILMAAVFVWVSGVVIKLVFKNANARLETVGRLFASFVRYAVWIAVLFYALSLIGVDSASLWASAGVVTLIVGLGAQTLIKDVIAGIFLVFEGEICVGDIVTVGGWTGTVQEIGIRTTKIEDGSQNIKVFNNSSVSDVVNMTKKYSCATVDLTISYETPLEKFEALLKENLPSIAHRLPNIVSGPFYKGVVSVDSSQFVVRVTAQCAEADRGQLERDLTRQLLLICDHNGVAPYKGAYEYIFGDVQATPEERKAAAEFVKEQGLS
jgi:moderate conductance mechanosensitive channel